MRIVCRDVTIRFGSVTALRHISLQVASGSFFALLGANGAGKSTLIAILSTLLSADEGEVRIDDLDIRKHPRSLRRHIGIVFQKTALDGRLSARENLEFHAALQGLGGQRGRRLVEAALSEWELEQVAMKPARLLSGGMQRRLELARALLHDPLLLLLDEPAAGLDAGSRTSLLELLAARRREGTTVVMSTHYPNEADVCDAWAMLDEGFLVASGGRNQISLAEAGHHPASHQPASASSEPDLGKA